MYAYYNEFDPKAAAWLRELIKRGLIADGMVDERSILDVQADDLRGFVQCHFFAGIGGWSYALRLADASSQHIRRGSGQGNGASSTSEGEARQRQRSGDDDCAGRADGGLADANGWDASAERQQRSGEQRQQQEDSGASVGLADAKRDEQRSGRGAGCEDQSRPEPRTEPSGRGEAGRLADAADEGLSVGRRGQGEQPGSVEQSERLRADERLADAGSRGSAQGLPEPQQRQEGQSGEHDDSRHQSTWREAASAAARPSPTNGHWRDADWLFCRDGKWRPVEPGTFPLAHGLPARVGRLRGYGNAIVPQAAAAFITAFQEALEDQ